MIRDQMRRLLEQHGIDNLSQKNVDQYFNNSFNFYDACMQGMNNISLEDIITRLKQKESLNDKNEELSQIFEEYRDQYKANKSPYSMIGMDIDVTKNGQIRNSTDWVEITLKIKGTLRDGPISQGFVVSIVDDALTVKSGAYATVLKL